MNENQFEPGIGFPRQMDQQDPLKDYRERFYIAEADTIYLDGNSLGRLPLATLERIQQVTGHEWGTRLIRSWNDGWYGRSKDISEKLARIIGADAEEVITGDSTSLNLYKLAFAALKKQTGKKKIVSDNLNFPTDLYVLQGLVEHFGKEYELVLASSKDGQTVDMATLEETVDENTALVVLSHVAFKSAFMYDMKAVTDLVHRKGSLMLWDLSHAAGVVPVELSSNNVDLAVGCTYKYLNGGPGSPAYLYVKKELQEKLSSPVWGWFGDSEPFSFRLQYHAADGINKFLIGTPPVLSLEAIAPGLDIILDAGVNNIREKSVLQTNYLFYLFRNLMSDAGFIEGTPGEANRRGSHVSLRHPEAYRICKALISPLKDTYKVIPDFREPDHIRLGIAPLYTSFTDIFLAVERIRTIVVEKEYESISYEKNAVT